MPTHPSIALVVHGHFYQPPRENPWTDEVPEEPSAAPLHDWNARIHAECYRANAWARVYGPDDRVRAMVNNYGRLSFNFGPTLARWMDRHDPRTVARIRTGDAEQRRRLGHGGALAQVWGHPITPLCTPRDRRTQILWGLADFRRRFGRPAAGIWLPETAADPATLEALIDAGVRFTIVAPEQIAAVRPPDGAWQAVTRDTVDTGRAYRWLHGDGSGRSLALAVFDGALSRALAFGNATRDSATFLARVRASAERPHPGGPRRRLVLGASDGELYGHHKKFADLTLAWATAIDAAKEGIDVTNLEAFLAAEPPTWEAELAQGPHGEGTAWSCGHGLGRWRRHCGCAMRGDRGWSQAWRGPLRDALDLLRDRAAAFFEDAAGDLFADPWAARDRYGSVVDDPPARRAAFARAIGRPALRKGRGPSVARAHRLLDMQRATLLMYASCGWFFDDIAGLESVLVLRQAAHAMDLWRALGGRPPMDDLLDVLAGARSNEPGKGTGADVLRRAARDQFTPALAVALAAFARLAGAADPAAGAAVPGFDVSLRTAGARAAGGRRLALQGRATVTHRRSGETGTLAFSAWSDGQTRFEARAGEARVRLADLPPDAARPIRRAALARLAAAPCTVAICRRALALADELGPLGSAEAAATQALFARLLVKLLEAQRPGRIGAAVLAVAGALAERGGLPAKTEEGHIAEELVWEALAEAGRRRPLPRELAALARRLRLSIGEPAARAVAADGPSPETDGRTATTAGGTGGS